MSKLTLIRHTLEENPNVTIVNVNEKNYSPGEREDFKGYIHPVDFHVAPKTGLYTADELQEVMVGLVPKGLEPSKVVNFSQWYGRGDGLSDLILGRLHFNEKVGGERRITKRILTLSDKELSDVIGFVDGKRTIDTDVTEEYSREIVVEPYPNEAFARDFLDGKIERRGSFNPGVLKKYQPNP